MQTIKELFTVTEVTDGKEATELLTVPGKTDGIIIAKGGKAEKRAYTDSEYQKIRAEADEYVINGYDYGNYYDYQNGGKEGRMTVEREPGQIPDGCILVKDGAFYGALLEYKGRTDGRLKEHYYTIAVAGGEKDVYISFDRNYSEWGNTFSCEHARVEKRK